MSLELKPCPFCGGPAETDSNRSYRAIGNGVLGRGVAVYCTQCNADMMYCCEDLVGCTPEQILGDLIENWNRRPPTTLETQSKIVDLWLRGEENEARLILEAFKIGRESAGATTTPTTTASGGALTKAQSVEGD